jgi:phosphoenolpyruvate carboxykinase (ATP)
MSSVLQTPEVSQLLGQHNVHRNLLPPQVVEAALRRGEAELAARGSLVAGTGKRTGRSPKDKFTVKDSVTENKIAWGSVNLPFPSDKFDALYDRVLDYLRSKELFVQDLFCGADPQYRLPIQVINEYAWHNLFVRQLFIRPTGEELETHKPEFTIVSAPGFLADPKSGYSRRTRDFDFPILRAGAI